MQGCGFGPASLQQFSPYKCHGRPEMACAPLFSDTGTPCSGGSCPSGHICGTTNTCLQVIPACLPQCNSDADCGGGLYCDPSDGLCRSTPTTGKAVGAACNQQATVDECKGNCIGIVDSSAQVVTTMCAENCTWGALPACGWNGPASGAAPAACLFASTVIFDGGGPGFGDRGSCGQLCNCNSDCLNPAFICSGFGDATLEAAYGKKGFCSIPQLADGGVDPGIASP